MDKTLYAFHVVLTTHNSRTSKRMTKYGVIKGPKTLLNHSEEIKLTEAFKQVILEKGFQCIAYNICYDHIHIVLVCYSDELPQIVRVLKSKTSYLFGLSGYKEKGKPLWSQKYYWSCLNNWSCLKTTVQTTQTI